VPGAAHLHAGLLGGVATRVPGVAQAVVAEAHQDEAQRLVHCMAPLLHYPADTILSITFLPHKACNIATLTSLWNRQPGILNQEHHPKRLQSMEHHLRHDLWAPS
jgi:hypothetical protein